MSWGCRIYSRRTRSPLSILSSAPAQHLEFLYPRWLGSAAIPAPSPPILEPLGPEEREAKADGAKAYAYTPQLFGKKLGSAIKESVSRKAYDPGLPEADIKHHDVLHLAPKIYEDEIAIPPTSPQAIGTESIGLGMRTLEEVLGGKFTGDQSSFWVKEPTIRRYGLLGRATGDDEAETRRLAMMYTVDQWDWRILLLDLRKHYRPDPDFEAEANLATPSKRPRYQDTAVQDIPRPETWTEESFASYVTDLTRSQVARAAHRQVYHGRESHRSAVCRHLVELFSEPSLQQLISVATLNTAIVFLLRQHRIDAVRKLFNIAARLRLRFTPFTFNLMLRAAAERRDFHNFGFLLQLMISQSVAPNQATWTAFLSLLATRAQKFRALHIMRALGILAYRRTFAGVIVHFMPAEVAIYLGPTRPLSHFLDHLNARYGDVWITKPAINIIVRYLAQHVRSDDLFALLAFAKSRRCECTRLALDTYLTFCTKDTSLTSLARLMASFQTDLAISPTSRMLDRLFRLAWRRGAYNTTKLAWRAATVYGTVSSGMQRRTLESLLRNTPLSPTTPITVWFKEAAKVLVGTEFGDPSVDHEERRAHADLVASLANYAEPEARPRTRRLALMLMARDLDARRFYRLDVDLMAALALAAQRDEEWEREGLADVPNLAWKMAHSIEVPVVSWRHRPGWEESSGKKTSGFEDPPSSPQIDGSVTRKVKSLWVRWTRPIDRRVGSHVSSGTKRIESETVADEEGQVEDDEDDEDDEDGEDGEGEDDEGSGQESEKG